MNNLNNKIIELKRETKETKIKLSLSLSQETENSISTGIGIFDHMLNSLALHAGWTLILKAEGDLQVDDHHTVEDCAIIIGQAIDKIMDDRTNIARYGYAYAPLDESLSRAVVDLVTRPYASVNLGLVRDKVGELSCENVSHFLETLAINGRFTLHLDLIRGANDHHKIESAFKALALALKQAMSSSQGSGKLSTKGSL